MFNFLGELIIDFFVFSILPDFDNDSDRKNTKRSPSNLDSPRKLNSPRKHPTIAENVAAIRKEASKIYGRTNVNAFLDTPLIDGLSPWQLTINGRSSEVLRKLRG